MISDLLGNDTATLALCSLSALEWIMKPKSSYSSTAAKNGRRIWALLSAVIGSKQKASEIIGKIYFPSSSIMTSDGGKHVSVIHCPVTSSSTAARSRQIERIYTKGGGEQEELSIRTETLRRSPLQKKKKKNKKEDRRLGAFFLATYDSSVRTVGDLVQRKTLPGTKYDLLYFSAEDWVSKSRRYMHLVKKLNGSNIKSIRNF